MIKVLHLYTSLDCGGVESFLYNYYSKMNQKEIKFDFIVPGSKVGYLEEKLVKLNSTIYHVSSKRNNYIKHCVEVNKIIKNGNYDIIHCHGYKSVLGLIIGKHYGCKVRIIHSHMAYVKENCFTKIMRKISTILLNKYSTAKFACGLDASNWLYGKESKPGEITIINNAIDLKKYAYNEKSRKKIREELNAQEKIIIGNIARLTYQKNQMFLLQVIHYLKKIDKNILLLLVGNGEDEEMLKSEVKKLKLEKNVLFLGLRKDIPELLSAIDVFVLPSRYEGLPVVLSEVQAAGVPSIVSDTITKEIDVTSNINYISLEKDPSYWASSIYKIYKNMNYKKRLEKNSKMKFGKYDIDHQADMLFKKYKSLLNATDGEKNNEK